MLKKLILLLTLIKCISSFESNKLAQYEATFENFNGIRLLEELADFSNGTACGDSVIEYLEGLTKIQIWAVQMLDSSAKIPDGILSGNQKDLGVFDECLKVQHPLKMFVGQHCLLDVSLHLFPASGPLGDSEISSFLMPTITNYGLCLPSTCSAAQIEYGLNYIFNITSLSNITQVKLNPENCRTTEPRKLKDTDWAVVGVLVAFGAIAVISTLYDLYQQFYKNNKKPHQLLSSFSIYSNGKFIFQISENPNQLKALHGIRVLSMSWIILCHAYLTVAELFAPSTNLLELVNIIMDDNHVVITNGFVAVDTFFFLSGLLVCLVFFRDISRKGYFDVPLAYIHRYIRLTPPFAIMMLIQATIFMYIGDGPYWYNVNEPAAAVCRKSWWSGLLYVQSFVDANSNCVSQSWYLSTDMELYWLSPLVLYTMYFFPAMVPYFLAVLTLMATFATFTVVYVNKLGASLGVNLSNTAQMDLEYVRFYSRATPYLLGIATGYIICGIQAKKIKIKLNPLMVCVGWLAAAGLCLGALYGITAFTDYVWTPLEAGFYVAFHRLMWGLGLAWLTIACITGYGGPINAFLSWNIFQPLGKLSYSVYLAHTAVQMYRIASLRTGFYAGDIELTWYFLGDLVMTHLVAIPLTLIFEIPFGNIDRYVFRNVAILPYPQKKKSVQKIEKKTDESNNNLNNAEEGKVNKAFENESK